MTEDIANMAREAGLLDSRDDWSSVPDEYRECIEYFAQRVTAVEREACAQICADRAKDFQELFQRCEYEEDEGAMKAALQCEELIRARGQQ